MLEFLCDFSFNFKGKRFFGYNCVAPVKPVYDRMMNVSKTISERIEFPDCDSICSESHSSQRFKLKHLDMDLDKSLIKPTFLHGLRVTWHRTTVSIVWVSWLSVQYHCRLQLWKAQLGKRWWFRNWWLDMVWQFSSYLQRCPYNIFESVSSSNKSLVFLAIFVLLTSTFRMFDDPGLPQFSYITSQNFSTKVHKYHGEAQMRHWRRGLYFCSDEEISQSTVKFGTYIEAQEKCNATGIQTPLICTKSKLSELLVDIIRNTSHIHFTGKLEVRIHCSVVISISWRLGAVYDLDWVETCRKEGFCWRKWQSCANLL